MPYHEDIQVSGGWLNIFQTLALGEGDLMNSVALLIHSYNELFSLFLSLCFVFIICYLFCIYLFIIYQFISVLSSFM